ncbi:conserved hypothetical protein [delta proteobacterium NaphS2]|nr:conserved hypothetical protein [delta proteobacterium NaphS2]
MKPEVLISGTYLLLGAHFLGQLSNFSLGETPVKPVAVPAGKYILLVPSGFYSNQESPIKIDMESGKRKFFVLKLFSPRSGGNDEDYGAGGGAGAGR